MSQRSCYEPGYAKPSLKIFVIVILAQPSLLWVWHRLSDYRIVLCCLNRLYFILYILYFIYYGWCHTNKSVIGWVGARQAFFWYDNDKNLKTCFAWRSWYVAVLSWSIRGLPFRIYMPNMNTSPWRRMGESARYPVPHVLITMDYFSFEPLLLVSIQQKHTWFVSAFADSRLIVAGLNNNPFNLPSHLAETAWSYLHR